MLSAASIHLPILQLDRIDEIGRAAFGLNFLPDELRVNVDRGDVVHNAGNTLRSLMQQVSKKCRLSDPKETRQQDHGNALPLPPSSLLLPLLLRHVPSQKQAYPPPTSSFHEECDTATDTDVTDARDFTTEADHPCFSPR